MSEENRPVPQILRLREVLARTGLSRSSLYQLSSQGKFPRPVRLTERAVGWREGDVNRWIDSREDVL